MKFTITKRNGMLFFWVNGEMLLAITESAWSFALANAKVIDSPPHKAGPAPLPDGDCA